MREKIKRKVDEIRNLLLEKNRAYGNSALDPVRILSKASPDEQLLVRMDDKLSRIVRGKEEGEDVVLDLIGYAVLYAISIDKDFVYLTRSCAADLIEKINDVNMATRFIHQMCDDLLDVATKLYEYKKEQKYKIETFLAELGNDLITFNLEQALLFAAHFLLWSLQKENDNDH